MDDQEPTVKFVPRLDPDHPPLMIVAQHDYKGCRHERSFIDAQARKLTCQACGVDLDPYELLGKLAREGMNLDSRVAAIKEQHEKEIAAQKRKEEDAKNAVPNTISRLKAGWKIRVTTASGSMYGRAIVRSITDTELVLGHGEEVAEKYDTRVQRADVTAIRVLKKG